MTNPGPPLERDPVGRPGAGPPALRTPGSAQPGSPGRERRPAGQIGRFFGVPVVVSPSWLLIALFVTISFADLFAGAVSGNQGNWAYLMSLGYAVLSALCVLLHELGHTAVALALGLRVRRVTIFLLGGVSELDPEPRRPRDEFLVSAAGPLVSAALALAAWAVTRHTAPGSVWHVEALLLTWANLVIAVFNILPGLPLDGGRVLRAAVWGLGLSRAAATRLAAWSGRVLAAAVVVAGVLLPHERWGIVTALITVMLGVFLWLGASQNLTLARLSERVPALSAGSLVGPAVWVTPDLPLSEALRLKAESGRRSVVVVDSAGRVAGLLDDGRVKRVRSERRAWTATADAARPLSADETISAALRGQDLLDACQRHPAADYLVVGGDGAPVGTLHSADLRAWLEGHEVPVAAGQPR